MGELLRPSNNPLDPESSSFDTEAYVSQILKEKTLDELFDIELNTTKEVRSLESEMETLVYENYNKFITATDTIRKMKTDFVGIEEQMDQLADNIQNITKLSDKLGGALSGKRHDVQKLAKTNRTLKNLQFLFDLPETLQDYVDRKEYSLAVKSYLRTKPLLEQYKSTAAFGNIYAECQGLVDELKDQLRDQLCDSVGSTKQTAGAVESLLALGEPPDTLAESFLHKAEQHLTSQLQALNEQVALKSGDRAESSSSNNTKIVTRPSDAIPNLPMEVLEFVDTGLSNLLSDLSLLVNTYTHMFASEKLSADADTSASIRPVLQFANRMLAECFEVAERRFMLECEPSETNMVVRALDRFYRRLQATSKMMPGQVSYSASTLAIVQRVADNQVRVSFSHLNQLLHNHIKHARQQLAVGEQRNLTPDSASSAGSYLTEQLSTLEQNIVHDLKSIIVNLLQLVTCDVTFATETRFALAFSRCVREELVVKIFQAVCDIGVEFSDGRGDKQYCHATLILLLSRMCANLHASTASYIVDLCEQQLRMHSIGSEVERKQLFSQLTPTSVVTDRLAAVAQTLLDRYVQMEAHALSQLLVKSVQTRDWLGCPEPRAVRTVMKRLVEDLTAIDTRVGQLFEEGQRRDRSSESSRRTGANSMPLGTSVSVTGANRSSGAQLRPLGTDSINQALGNLWRDRIDYFASVQMNKVSVLTGIVKICLKTLLESVRLRTFATHGLQQVQVDCHYLQLNLWRFVYDEALVHCLLEEVVQSAQQRCLHAQLMSAAVVECICERG